MNGITERIPDYSEKDIQDKIILNIRDISQTMLALYEGRSSQKRVLIILSDSGDISQRELTVRLGIKPASVSELLARLEDNRMVTREASKADRRIQIISLTDEGRELAAALKSQRQKRHERMFDALSDDELKSFLSYLERINVDWDEKFR